MSYDVSYNCILRIHSNIRLVLGVLLVLLVCCPDISWGNAPNTLAHYLALPETVDPTPRFIRQSNTNGVQILEYELSSQQWPKNHRYTQPSIWKHRITVYIPEKVNDDTAILWINGGVISDPHFSKSKPYALDFLKIASQSHAVVIDLKDIPNQFIQLQGDSLEEDALIARTWQLFLDAPQKNEYMPLYLPMVKSVVKTMDALQKISKSHLAQFQKPIRNYMIGGASKRGLTTWLTALQDHRIIAIMPVVIDILNTPTVIRHIYSSYRNTWPVALHDYEEQGVLSRLNSPYMNALAKIDDPYQYLTCAGCEGYRKRLQIPKYLVYASGDDFFPPDSFHFYQTILPQPYTIRYIPNASHYVTPDIITDSMLTFFNATLHHISLPNFQFTWDRSTMQLQLHLNEAPQSVTLYTAHNPKKRDFRLNEGISYKGTPVPLNCKSYPCDQTLDLQPPASHSTGWTAQFVELQYAALPQFPNWILTTPVYILPERYPTTSEYGNAVKYPS
jgi:PhoPQ-activated pathogenicity-related protein